MVQKRKIGRPFEKGNTGRPKGAINKVHKTVKELVLETFNNIQDHPKVNLYNFAVKYPRDFYALAGKLIPTEINARLTKVELKIVRTTPERNVLTEIAPPATNGNGHSKEV